MKTTLNPFENAKRTAQGTGGSATIPPATANSIGGVKIGAGVNVTADGTISTDSYTPPAYSTNEIATGRKWIDGKDIYEKTVDIGTLPNSTSKDVAHGITYDNIISVIGSAKDSDGVILPLPYQSTNSTYAVSVTVNTTNIVIDTNYDRTGFSGYVTIQYTKTGA